MSKEKGVNSIRSPKKSQTSFSWKRANKDKKKDKQFKKNSTIS